ncbi:MAG: hypothetical protein KJ944_13075 [Alphaproteobacteria bacterium]|nr:hypothetical protein [Alphaproteobacteria bacterium]MBU1562763.1 hypothetical protein [Alphaproteobacteria bacterium]MBU2303519.1 hypothetical protein [Alphaproteobacteria bacterium]MBU2367044.1 hypothetical protein [Alphaproteobacteria bacterium]
MRVSVFLLICTLSLSAPVAAQSYRLDAPLVQGPPQAGDVNVPIGRADGLGYLEAAALSGDRRASALLAVLLQDSPDVEGNLVKSALHFQAAVAAGCSDLATLAARAVARLSPDQRAEFEQALPRWSPAGADVPQAGIKGRCLSW